MTTTLENSHTYEGVKRVRVTSNTHHYEGLQIGDVVEVKYIYRDSAFPRFAVTLPSGEDGLLFAREVEPA